MVSSHFPFLFASCVRVLLFSPLLFCLLLKRFREKQEVAFNLFLFFFQLAGISRWKRISTRWSMAKHPKLSVLPLLPSSKQQTHPKRDPSSAGISLTYLICGHDVDGVILPSLSAAASVFLFALVDFNAHLISAARCLHKHTRDLLSRMTGTSPAMKVS